MAIIKDTHTYKTVGDCEIKLDVYRSSGDDSRRPVIMWIHGGALIVGGREGISPWQLELYLNAGYSLISIDYRLAPETKLEEIIQDLQDAYDWIRHKGPELFPLDPDRIAVIGHSAGGYLTLMSGFCVEPRPRALVPFYGYGDIIGEWYSRPDPFYCQQPLVTKEEAYRTVGGKVIANSHEQNDRGRFYLYCRQNGLWPREVSGHDPDTEPEAFAQFCPVQNVTEDYPPTLLLHGDMDTDVPYQQSVIMARKLAQIGVKHHLVTIKGGGHGFDGAGMGDPTVAGAFKQVMRFLCCSD